MKPPTTHSILSRSSEETHTFAKAFGARLHTKATIAFSGELGAGKTTFIRGLAEGAAGIDPREVSSPTFGLLHIYEGKKKIYHFDLYRLPHEREFLLSGFEEFLRSEGICCIEWAEKIPSHLPKEHFTISLTHAGESARKITIIENPAS